MGSTAAGMMPNRRKYQSNEFITEAGLNWMSFGARQYDPQIGRFLSVDPLAAVGQDMFSPYAAMGDEPASLIDPNGMAPIPTMNNNQRMRSMSGASAYLDCDLFNLQLSQWGGVMWIYGDLGLQSGDISYGGLTGSSSKGLDDESRNAANKTFVKTQVSAGYTKEELEEMGYTVINQDDYSYTVINATGVVGNLAVYSICCF